MPRPATGPPKARLLPRGAQGHNSRREPESRTPENQTAFPPTPPLQGNPSRAISPSVQAHHHESPGTTLQITFRTRGLAAWGWDGHDSRSPGAWLRPWERERPRSQPPLGRPGQETRRGRHLPTSSPRRALSSCLASFSSVRARARSLPKKSLDTSMARREGEEEGSTRGTAPAPPGEGRPASR